MKILKKLKSRPFLGNAFRKGKTKVLIQIWNRQQYCRKQLGFASIPLTSLDKPGGGEPVNVPVYKR